MHASASPPKSPNDAEVDIQSETLTKNERTPSFLEVWRDKAVAKLLESAPLSQKQAAAAFMVGVALVGGGVHSGPL